MRIVFCGTAAGRRSAAVGAYYAGNSNKFWQVLADVGLTPRRLAPEEFGMLTSFGIGLTDLAKKHSGTDESIPGEAWDVAGFARRIKRAAPGIVAFNGKLAASVFFGRQTGWIAYGLQTEQIGASAVFVLPSTSGAASKYWSINSWTEIAQRSR